MVSGIWQSEVRCQRMNGVVPVPGKKVLSKGLGNEVNIF
jgi:hypothetical protein